MYNIKYNIRSLESEINWSDIHGQSGTRLQGVVGTTSKGRWQPNYKIGGLSKNGLVDICTDSDLLIHRQH